MDPNAIAIVVTALVGIAGILSTHLLARSQRRTDLARSEVERRDRYRFAAFETQAALCADYIAELRSVLMTAKVRRKFVPTFRGRTAELFAEDARAKAARSPNPKAATFLLKSAEDAERNPSLLGKMVDTTYPGAPPPVETMQVLHRLTGLCARIGLVSGPTMAAASKDALKTGQAFLLGLGVAEHDYFAKGFSIKSMRRAIERLEAAAATELRWMGPSGPDAAPGGD